MVQGRSARTLAGAALAGLLGTGCAASADAWSAKVREADNLKAKLQNEEAQHGADKKALAEESAKLEKLTHDLRAAGIDPDYIAARAEQQARAMEDHRRRAEQLDAMKRRAALLRDKLAPLAAEGVAVTVRNNRLVVQIPGDALFETGREALRRDARALLGKVAEVLRADRSLSARTWQVAGHVERGKPGGAFKDGWGLSVMRAREVLAYLITPADKGGGGLSPSRVSAAGYGDADPLDPGDSAEAKKANRRCEIVALPSVEETLDLKDIGR